MEGTECGFLGTWDQLPPPGGHPGIVTAQGGDTEWLFRGLGAPHPGTVTVTEGTGGGFFGVWGAHPPSNPPNFDLSPFSPHSRAGFARQGAKEKQLLREGNAFNVSSFVLRATMSGQYWPEGDELYHAELAVPVLLVHGMHDKFVPVEEDQRMAEVPKKSSPGQGFGA